MSWLIIICSILLYIEGFISLLWSRQYKIILRSTLPEAPVKSLSIFVGVFGILIVRASYGCRIQPPLFIIGSIVFIKGILGILIPDKLMRAVIEWWINLSLWVYRVWGIVMLGIGTIFLICR